MPNLATFFERVGMKGDQTELAPGDIIVWDLGRGVLHIDLLSDERINKTPLAIHNICCGVKQEDILNEYKVVGKYRLTNESARKLRKLQRVP